MYEKYPKICISAFILCVICFLFSPKESSNVSIQEVSAKEATTKTGRVESGVLQKVQSWAKEDRKKETVQKVDKWSSNTWIDCDKDCKIRTLIDLGIRKEIAESLVNACKKQDIEVISCIKLWASISVSESWGWKRCNNNWCFGILAKWTNYKAITQWVEDWVRRFWKYWKNQKTPSSFYSNSPSWKPKTWYCLSERQADWTMLPYCKNWYKHSWNIFNKLNF